MVGVQVEVQHRLPVPILALRMRPALAEGLQLPLEVPQPLEVLVLPLRRQALVIVGDLAQQIGEVAVLDALLVRLLQDPLDLGQRPFELGLGSPDGGVWLAMKGLPTCTP